MIANAKRPILVVGHGAFSARDQVIAMAEETGLPVMVSDEPMSAVVLGSGKALDHLDLLREVTIA